MNHSLICPDHFSITETEDGNPVVLINGVVATREAMAPLIRAIEFHGTLTNEQISRWNEQIALAREERYTDRTKPAKERFVYVMKNSRSGLFKIGLSHKPRFRETTLQSQEPEVELVFSESGSLKLESALHEHFASKRVRGEWFNLAESDVNAIPGLIVNWKESP